VNKKPVVYPQNLKRGGGKPIRAEKFSHSPETLTMPFINAFLKITG
jgi:hypothetical protein